MNPTELLGKSMVMRSMRIPTAGGSESRNQKGTMGVECVRGMAVWRGGGGGRRIRR